MSFEIDVMVFGVLFFQSLLLHHGFDFMFRRQATDISPARECKNMRRPTRCDLEESGASTFSMYTLRLSSNPGAGHSNLFTKCP